MTDPSNDIELERLNFWPRDAVERLKAASITSAPQLVAIAGTGGGVRSLAEQARMDEPSMRDLVDRTAARLGGAVEASRVDTSDYGLGVLGPE